MSESRLDSTDKGVTPSPAPVSGNGEGVITTACPFCAIVAGRGPATVTERWPDTIAVVPLGPATEGHTLIIPHAHFSRPEHYPHLAREAAGAAIEYAAARGEDYHLIVNVGADAGQTVPHLHWHYLPRRAGDWVRMPWPHPPRKETPMSEQPHVPRPAGLEQFDALATRLYNQPDCDTGGPLHVELDDHNTELLVGDHATEKIDRFTTALAMIEAGNIPPEPAAPMLTGEGWTEAHLIHNAAHYHSAEALRIAIELLQTTRDWSEDQADAAYAWWQRGWIGGPCTCTTYPQFDDEAEAADDA